MQNYLQQILNESNTIIIPGLGALTVTSTKTGDIYFMPFLNHDDGTLVKYISNNEGIELIAAKNTISNFVANIQSSLENGGNYEMEGFGRFLINKDGDYDFQRWEDYQTKDVPNTILSKKINERKLFKEKTQVPKSTTPSIDKIIAQEEPVKIEEQTKSETEIQLLHEELPIPVNPVEEPDAYQSITEQKSSDELLVTNDHEAYSLQLEPFHETVIISNEFITPIEEELSAVIETSQEHKEVRTLEEVIEAPEREIFSPIDSYKENIPPSIIQTKEDKKALRKKIKNDRSLAKAAEKQLLKAAKKDVKEIESHVPKEKKKSRSMILWLSSAILLTLGTMWYIKKQRDSKVQLTVIDKNESKIITKRLIEKKDLPNELSKHTVTKTKEKIIEANKNNEVIIEKKEDIVKENKVITPIASKPNIENSNNNNSASVVDPKTLNTTKPNSKNNSTPPANIKINSVIITSTPIIQPVPALQKTNSTPNITPGYTSPNKNIQVIVGSFKDKVSADRLLSNLKTDGFSNAYTKEMNGSYQVSLGSFTTLSESNKALQKYRGDK